MKKILAILCALTIVSLYADTEWDAKTYEEGNYIYGNGVFTFSKNLVWADFSRRVDTTWEKTNAKISADDVVRFGYYTINADGTHGDYITMYDRDNSANNSSAIFKAGDQIGMFMDVPELTFVKDSNGVYTKDDSGNYVKASSRTRSTRRYSLVSTGEVTRYTTTDTGDDSQTAGAHIDHSSYELQDGSAHQYFCIYPLGQDHMDEGGAHFEYYFEGLMGTDSENVDEFISYLNNVNGAGNELSVLVNGAKYEGTSGQPLPGILATVLVGGCALGFMKKRKHAKKN